MTGPSPQRHKEDLLLRFVAFVPLWWMKRYRLRIATIRAMIAPANSRFENA